MTVGEKSVNPLPDGTSSTKREVLSLSFPLLSKAIVISMSNFLSRLGMPTFSHGTELPLLFKLWSIGVVLLVGGNSVSWNIGLQAGSLGFSINTTLASTGFASMALCISEILSGLPFSGGAFGMVRCTVVFSQGLSLVVQKFAII